MLYTLTILHTVFCVHVFMRLDFEQYSQDGKFWLCTGLMPAIKCDWFGQYVNYNGFKDTL